MAIDTVRVSLGIDDPFKRVPTVELRDDTLTFIPGDGMRDTLAVTHAPFPPGSRVEYRVEMGDMFYAGDQGQPLSRSLWVIAPNGSSKLLAREFLLYISLKTATANLANAGIPFRAVKICDDPNGQHTETEITPFSRLRLSAAFVVGTSGLWLGAIAGIVVHGTWSIAAIGICAVLIYGCASIATARAKLSAALKFACVIPSYAAGYALAVVLVRNLISR